MAASERERAMWASVVLQAKEDVEFEARGSDTYNDAVAFFMDGRALWVGSRQVIADFLDLHPDDLTRLGATALAHRDRQEPAEMSRARAAKPDQSPRDREWWIKRFLANNGS